jgi:hypothetical protein
MTETEWLECGDVEAMIACLGAGQSERKLRLFMCGCCRRVWSAIKEPHCIASVEIAERYVDGKATEDEWLTAQDNVDWAWSSDRTDGNVLFHEAAKYPTDPKPREIVDSCVACILDALRYRLKGDVHRHQLPESVAQAALLRDIIGNPFRPITFSLEWRTATAVSLAHQVYESRDFSAMPILADALQDAGCDNEDILNHCRNAQQVHVRGCWVVDAILGKE